MKSFRSKIQCFLMIDRPNFRQRFKNKQSSQLLHAVPKLSAVWSEHESDKLNFPACLNLPAKKQNHALNMPLWNRCFDLSNINVNYNQRKEASVEKSKRVALNARPDLDGRTEQPSVITELIKSQPLAKREPEEAKEASNDSKSIPTQAIDDDDTDVFCSGFELVDCTPSSYEIEKEWILL